VALSALRRFLKINLVLVIICLKELRKLYLSMKFIILYFTVHYNNDTREKKMDRECRRYLLHRRATILAAEPDRKGEIVDYFTNSLVCAECGYPKGSPDTDS
jgi:hypothetical protein